MAFLLIRTGWMVWAVLAVAGCSRETPDAEVPRVAVIPKGTTHEFWKSVEAGALKAEAEADVDVIWIGPEREDARRQQIDLVNNQVLQGVDAIVLAPLDDRALRRPVADAVNRGVPVVIFDSGLADADGLISSFVATDNYAGGRLAGDAMVKSLDGEGRVAVLRYQEGSASTARRVKGFLDAVADVYGIEIVSADQYGGATTAEAQQTSEAMLLRFQDNDGNLALDGIFCCNESTTFGMLQALRRQNATGDVVFIGFDSSQPLVEALETGEIDGSIVQNPFQMGYQGVMTALDVLGGRPVEVRIDTGVALVTKDRLGDPAIQALVTPAGL